MEEHLKKILVLIDTFGPIETGIFGINKADANALKKLGFVKETRKGWVATRKGKKQCNA